MPTLTNNPFLNYCFALVGALTLGLISIKILDFVYIYGLHSSRLHRYQHSKGKTDGSDAQETRAWALVTGASDGIGFQLAIELARNGFNLVLHGRNPTKLEDKASQVRAKFPKVQVRTTIADASDERGMEKRVTEIANEMENLPGPLTILINNVGGLPKTTDKDWSIFDEQSITDIDLTIQMNLRFPTLLTRTLMPLLKRQAPGLVIVVGSGASDFNAPYLTIYGASKAYLKTWTQALGAELKLDGYDVEMLGINVFRVTETNVIKEAVTFMVPSANTMAKAILARVGCGKMWLWGYYGHAIQGALLNLVPAPLLRWIVARMTRSLKEQFGKTV